MIPSGRLRSKWTLNAEEKSKVSASGISDGRLVRFGLLSWMSLMLNKVQRAAQTTEASTRSRQDLFCHGARQCAGGDPVGLLTHWPPSGPLTCPRAARYLPFYPHSRGLEVNSESFIPR